MPRMFTQIALIADDSRRDYLKDELARFGIAAAARGADPSSLAGVLIDGFSAEVDTAAFDAPDNQFCALLASPFETSVNSPEGFALSPSVTSFVQQFRIHQRQQQVLREAELRRQTLDKMGASFVIPNGFTSIRGKTILFYGEPSALYLKFKRAMTEKGYAVEAVLSERTAFEALRTHNPAAFVVHIRNAFYPYELLDHVHGRADLKSMPVIGIADTGEVLPDSLDALSALVRVGADFETATASMTRFVENSIISAPVHAPDCLAPARDTYSNCFSREFAELHILEQAAQAQRLSQPITGAVVQPFKLDSGDALSATGLSPFSALLHSVVRQQDFVTRADWADFVITMPGASEVEAEGALDRARRVLEMTPSKTGEYFSFRFELNELQPNQSAAHFMKRLMDRPASSTRATQSNVA